MIDAKLQENLNKLEADDLKILAKAKRDAQIAVNKDPSEKNLKALEKASELLGRKLSSLNAEPQAETSDKTGRVFRSVPEILQYVKDNNRKVKQAKVYKDIKSGLLKRSEGGVFYQEDVDRYMAGLPALATPVNLCDEAAERQKQKELWEIRLKEATAKTQEHKLAILQGRYILKDDAYAELAARAIVFSDTLKNNFEAQTIEIINAVKAGENSEKLAIRFNEIIEFALAEYAKPLNVEIDFRKILTEKDGDGEAETKGKSKKAAKVSE